MANSTDCQYYWGKVIDALALVYAYKKAGTDEFEFQIRSYDFPEAINKVCVAYQACNRSSLIPFGPEDDEEVDLFFHELVMHPRLLKKIYRRALDYFDVAAPAVPLYTLSIKVKQEIK